MRRYSTPPAEVLRGRALEGLGMLAGMYTTPPAHEVIYVWCVRCGHKAYVAPELWRRSKKRHCRECGSRDYDLRIIWHQGPLPDNVVPIRRGWREEP
jgi:DNA-directed RNA polymerase subunit RPC12/RpoP